MLTPIMLEQAMDRAFDALTKHAPHDLGLGYRQSIYAALGPRADQPGTINLRGYRRRTLLEIYSVRHLADLWNRMQPPSNIPWQVLALTEKVMYGEIEVALAERELQRYLALAGNLEPERQVIALSACTALETAISDQDFDPQRIDYDRTDEDDNDDGQAYRDASGWAAHAYAGGAVWDEKSSADRRREFWQWWLREAVPMVYQPVD